MKLTEPPSHRIPRAFQLTSHVAHVQTVDRIGTALRAKRNEAFDDICGRHQDYLWTMESAHRQLLTFSMAHEARGIRDGEARGREPPRSAVAVT
jgi:hypothetical protein